MEKSMAERKIKELGELAQAAEKQHAISIDENIAEDTQDAAYEEYWNYLRKMAAVIVDLIHVDEKIALKMAAQKTSKIVELVKRMAA